MKIKLSNVRLSFNDLYEPTQVNNSGKHKYRATFLVEKGSENHKKIETAITQVAKDKWGAKSEAVLAAIRPNNMRFNVQDGDLSDYDGYAGNVVVKSSGTVKPIVIGRDRQPVAEDSGVIYSGCYVNAVVTFFGYDNQGKGISASLGGVQFMKDGDKFGGGGSTSIDEFDDLATDEFEEDPLMA